MFDFQPLQTLSLAMRHLPFRVSQQSLDIYDYPARPGVGGGYAAVSFAPHLDGLRIGLTGSQRSVQSHEITGTYRLHSVMGRAASS